MASECLKNETNLEKSNKLQDIKTLDPGGSKNTLQRVTSQNVASSDAHNNKIRNTNKNERKIVFSNFQRFFDFLFR